MKMQVKLKSIILAVVAFAIVCHAIQPPVPTEKILDSEIVDMLWLGEDQETVLILTEKQTLYRSVDGGGTWIDQTNALQADMKDKRKPDVTSIVVSTADKNRAILIGSGTTHWATSDRGETYQILSSVGRGYDSSPDECWPIRFNPKQPGMLLMAFKASGCRFSEACDDLFYSTDFGHTLTGPIAKHVIGFEWGAAGLWKDMPDQAIFVTALGDGNQASTVGFVRSDDFFVSNHTVVANGAHFAIMNGFAFVEVERPTGISTKIELHVSIDGVNFRQARMASSLPQNGYYILDTSEGAVFIHVMSERFSGDVLLSDSTGSRYAISLQSNVRDDYSSAVDFMKVSGLQGVYIGNVLMGKVGASDKIIQSRITFDKGGSWVPLQAPLLDYNKSATSCFLNEGCALHLHGESSSYASFYTSEHAPGLILGSGNLGSHLYATYSEVNTYFSRDGGRTWFEIKKGDHTFEFGDHGGLMVLAQRNTRTKVVHFSRNEGASWEDFTFTDTPMSITNVISEPGAVDQEFLIYGSRFVENRLEGVIVHLNFTAMMARQCVGVDTPDLPSSDYESWIPTDADGGHCLLGHETTYVRRKRMAECYNGEQFERVIYNRDCSCTEIDWECDVGFVRVSATDDGRPGPCIPEPGFNATSLLDPPAYCPVGSNYEVSNGYRLVAGDTCFEGVQHPPTMVPCPQNSTPDVKSYAGIIVLVLFAVVFLALVGLGFWNREKILDWCATFSIRKPRGSGGVSYGRLRMDQDDDTDTRLLNDDDDDQGGFAIADDDVDDDADVMTYTDLQKASAHAARKESATTTTTSSAPSSTTPATRATRAMPPKLNLPPPPTKLSGSPSTTTATTTTAAHETVVDLSDV